jgi:hypothetical protein
VEGEGAGNEGEEFKFEGFWIIGDVVVALNSFCKSNWVVCCC